MFSANQIYDAARKHTPMDGLYAVQQALRGEVFDLPEDDPAGRVVARDVFQHDVDDRRFIQVRTVWFDDRPVLISQRAGREGRDHEAVFVTDEAVYREMIVYLRSIMEVDVYQDVVDPAEAREDLTCFYGMCLEPSDLEPTASA